MNTPGAFEQQRRALGGVVQVTQPQSRGLLPVPVQFPELRQRLLRRAAVTGDSGVGTARDVEVRVVLMQQRPDLPCRGPQQRCGLRAAGRHRRAVALRPGAAVVPEDEDRETLRFDAKGGHGALSQQNPQAAIRLVPVLLLCFQILCGFVGNLFPLQIQGPFHLVPCQQARNSAQPATGFLWIRHQVRHMLLANLHGFGSGDRIQVIPLQAWHAQGIRQKA
mmetsp:Transcript_27530/g.44357  ORF Transcript_27530/g.44357 Transcript_27530/m.44357 type:complete len:221 (-) Transcript_27530:401-1063(-)